MKKIAIVVGVFFLMPSAYATCIDLSGDYSINFDPIGRENVTSVIQNGCDSIALGLYKFNHQTGLKEDESLSLIQKKFGLIGEAVQ
jgi:hypothetical protein